jgi:hypothetical protein
MTTVKYENKTVQVTENLPGKDFEKGTYFVNVFDKIKWFLKLVLFWNKTRLDKKKESLIAPLFFIIFPSKYGVY